MKILYVISRPIELNTSSSIRNRATILGLVENGHEVTLLTTEADKNHSAFDAKMCLDDVVTTKRLKLSGIQSVARVGRKFKFLRHLRSKVYHWMAKHEIYDNFKAMANYTDQVSLKDENFDLIISSSDPKSSHLFVSTLLNKQGKDFKGKWIQIWGDPFAGDITLTAKNKIALIRKEEHRLLCEADKVVYVSKLTQEAQQESYPDCAGKMFHYPIPYMNQRITKNRDLRNAEQIRLLYCGDFISKTRNILPLYNAVKQMDSVSLTICGLSDILLPNTENITVHSRIPYDQVCDLENKTDILVHLSNLKGSQIPGKIYQYSGTNKPILFILDGNKVALRNMFEKYGRYCFTENDQDSIVHNLQKIKDSKNEYVPIEEFSRKSIAKNILDGRK